MDRFPIIVRIFDKSFNCKITFKSSEYLTGPFATILLMVLLHFPGYRGSLFMAFIRDLKFACSSNHISNQQKYHVTVYVTSFSLGELCNAHELTHKSVFVSGVARLLWINSFMHADPILLDNLHHSEPITDNL